MWSSLYLPIMLILEIKLPESSGEKATRGSNAQASSTPVFPPTGGGGCSPWLCSILNSRAVQNCVCSLPVLAPVPLACFQGTKGQSEQGLLSLAETSPPATKSIHIRIPGSGLLGRKLDLTSRSLSLCEYHSVTGTEVRLIPDRCYALNSNGSHFWSNPPALFRNSFPWRV